MGKKLRALRLFYLVIGGIIFTFGLIIMTLGIYSYYWLYETSSLFISMVAFLSPFYLLSGFLLMVTYYGLRHTLRFARYAGVAGCLLLFFIILLFFSPSAIFYAPLSFFFMLILFVIPILLLLFTFMVWNEIQGDKKIEFKSKTKKIIVIVVIGILIFGVLIFVIPEVNKKVVLGSLEYTNYDVGFGFNPPKGWKSEGYSSLLYTPIEINDFNNVSLFIQVIGSIYNKLLSLDELKESYFSALLNTQNYTVNFSLISQRGRSINGMNAYEYVYTYQNINENTTGLQIKTKIVLIATNTKGLIITYHSLFNLYGLYDDVIEQSINSITIV